MWAAPGQFIFKNSEILRKPSIGISTAVAPMSDQPAPKLEPFIQASIQSVFVLQIEATPLFATTHW